MLRIGQQIKELIYICCRNTNPPAAYISEFFLFRSFHGRQRLLINGGKLFYIYIHNAMKRIIKSKGDGINYLGVDPNGEYHNMRELEGGGFFEIMYEIGKGIIPKGVTLTKGEFILEK